MTKTQSTHPPTPTDLSVIDGAIAASNYEQAKELAKVAIQSGMLPSQYKTISQVIIGVKYLQELGISRQLSGLKNITVINGTPAVWGDLLVELVQRTGMIEWETEEYEGEGDNRACVYTVKRRDREKPLAKRFDIATARRMNLLGKSPWKSDPDNMLHWRAKSRAYRSQFADCLGGCHFAEEVYDHLEEYRGEVQPEPSKSQLVYFDENGEMKKGEPEPEPEIVDADFHPAESEPSEFTRLKSELTTCTCEAHLAEFNAMEVKPAHLSEAINDDEYDELHRLMDEMRKGFAS